MKKRLVLVLIVLTTFLFTQFFLFGEEIEIEVKVSAANVRSDATVKSPIAGVFKKGKRFISYLKIGKWYKIKLEQKDAYVHSSVVKVIGPVKSDTAEKKSSIIKKEIVEKPQNRKIRKKRKYINVNQKDVKKLNEIASDMRKDSIAFLSMIKKMKPEKVKTVLKKVEMVRVIKDGSVVYETKDKNSNTIYRTRLNDECIVLEKMENMYKITLKDNREGWIEEKNVQPFISEKKGDKIKFKGVSDNMIRQYIDIAETIYSRIAHKKIFADLIIKKYMDPENITEGIQYIELTKPFRRISKYFKYASGFYKAFIENNAILKGPDVSILSKLSAWAEVLFGKSTYTTEYQYESLNLDNSSTTREISAGGNFVINKSSKVAVRFMSKKDVIMTPYSTSDLDAGYSFSKDGKYLIDTGINLNSYSDDSSTTVSANDFKKMNFRVGGKLNLNPKTDLKFRYNFSKNSYSENETNDFSSHTLMFKTDMLLSSSLKMSAGIQGVFGSSESQFHDYKDIAPKLVLTINGQKTKHRFDLFYETLSYSEKSANTFNKMGVLYNKTTGKNGKNRNFSLGFINKKYPESKANDYNQVRGNITSSKYGKNQSNFTLSFYTNLFSENKENSYTDLRLDIGGRGKGFFSSVSTFFKLWHTPEGDDGDQVKPYVLDIYGKLGLNLGIIRIGPAFGLHLLFSSEEDTSIIKRDGNLFRFGGFAEADIQLGNKGRLTVTGIYEYGFVYNDEISIDNYTGVITKGDILQRHPTTLQLNSTLTFSVAKGLDVTGRLKIYKINTDMDENISINPLLKNSGFVLLAGIKYIFN